LAALDLGADVQQPINCLIIQIRQAVQSMGTSMGWTLEDNMVDGLIFFATFTSCRNTHPPFVQTGAESIDAGAEAVLIRPKRRTSVIVARCSVLVSCCATGTNGVSIGDAVRWQSLDR